MLPQKIGDKYGIGITLAQWSNTMESRIMIHVYLMKNAFKPYFETTIVVFLIKFRIQFLLCVLVLWLWCDVCVKWWRFMYWCTCHQNRCTTILMWFTIIMMMMVILMNKNHLLLILIIGFATATTTAQQVDGTT